MNTTHIHSANKRANIAEKKSLFDYAYDSIEVYIYVYMNHELIHLYVFLHSSSFCENIKKRAENKLNNNSNNNNISINSTQ